MVSEFRSLSCEDVDELSGAYALDALEPAELTAVEAHLDGCAEPHTALWEARETATLLAALPVPTRAPDALRGRILTAVADSRRGVSAAEDAEPATIATLRPARRNTAYVLPFALAAAFALLAIGLGAWALILHSDVAYERSQAAGGKAVLTALTAPGVAVQLSSVGALPPALLVEPSDGTAAMIVVNWPKAGQGKIYQAWAIPAGQTAVSAGIFDGSAAGAEVVTLTRTVSAQEAFAVTLEPAGGSVQPTSQPLLLRPPSS